MKRIVLAALVALAPIAVQAAPLRVAVLAPTEGPCKAPAPASPAGEKAYFALLSKRLETEVQACPVPDAASAAKALAAGKLDVAVLDPPAYAAVAKTMRPILTVRPKESLNRIPVLVGVKASGPKTTLAELRGGAIAFGGTDRASYDVPRRALADQGAGDGFFAREDKSGAPEVAVASLRAGKVDAMALNAAAWQRLCRGDTPNEDRCRDLKVVWQGRPRASKAIVVSRDMPLSLRYRIIGIHMAMHLEAKDAFAWASAFIPDGVEFEPTEPDALVVTAAAR